VPNPLSCTRDDGTGDIKHVGLAEVLKTPTPFLLDIESGVIAGYMTLEAIFCVKCIGKSHTPCAPRSLFSREDATSSAEEEAGEPTFTTALSGDSLSDAQKGKGAAEPLKVKTEAGTAAGGPSAEGVGEGGRPGETEGLTLDDFVFMGLLARRAGGRGLHHQRLSGPDDVVRDWFLH